MRQGVARTVEVAYWPGEMRMRVMEQDRGVEDSVGLKEVEEVVWMGSRSAGAVALPDEDDYDLGTAKVVKAVTVR